MTEAEWMTEAERSDYDRQSPLGATGPASLAVTRLGESLARWRAAPADIRSAAG